MATTNPISDAILTFRSQTGSGLLVLLAALQPEQQEDVIAKLTSAFPPEDTVDCRGGPAGGGGSIRG